VEGGKLPQEEGLFIGLLQEGMRDCGVDKESGRESYWRGTAAKVARMGRAKGQIRARARVTVSNVEVFRSRKTVGEQEK